MESPSSQFLGKLESNKSDHYLLTLFDGLQ